jgi:hypothetical protein
MLADTPLSRVQARSHIRFAVFFRPHSSFPQKIFSAENPLSTALAQPFTSSNRIHGKSFSKIYLARQILARYIHLALT